MSRLRSPIIRIGGKGLLVSKLIKLIPKHKVYAEPFCGGASLFFAKALSPIEVINDKDRTLMKFFQMLRDPGKFKEFYELIKLTPYSRAELENAFNTWRNDTNEIEMLRKWFVINRQSYAGTYSSNWSSGKKLVRKGIAKHVSAWLSAIDGLPEIVIRLKQAQIECIDYKKCILKYDSPDTFLL